jgi:Flp pilus assembly protein TadD
MLDSSLKVSAAAIETGQAVAARRLYEQLSQTFPNAPEPKLGLAYMALHAGDFTTADALFTEAGDLAETTAIKSEALLGVGRASLGREDLVQAKTHFLAAAALAEDTPVASWVANGLAVVASLEGDYPLADRHYNKAMKLSSAHPVITANLVRMLIESGRTDEARQLHSSKSASYWLQSDGDSLAQFIEDSSEEEGSDGAGSDGAQ